MKKRHSGSSGWGKAALGFFLGVVVGAGGVALALGYLHNKEILLFRPETKPTAETTQPTEPGYATEPSDVPPTNPPTEPPTDPPTTPPTQAPTEPTEAVEEWMLYLVNPWNKIREDYTVEFTYLANGHKVDKRCYPDLQEMMDDCRAAGLKPTICSSYRTQAKQAALYENKVQRVMAEGYSYEEALVIAAREVAIPGTSEHQLGLAVDIVDKDYQILDETQADRATQKWLMEHSWEYGFVLRYPTEKSEITGIIYEPWHYRYVGREAAREMHEMNLCLEEYLEYRAAG